MPIIDKQFGNYFEDFETGETIHHALGKTILESDNNLFCLLTMNHHPIHLDYEYAAREQHGQILVVGTYVFSLVVGLTVTDISGKAIANLGYSDLNHLGPVFVGDTLRCETTIIAKVPSKTKPDRGIVHVRTLAYNQHNDCVLSFERKVLVKRK